MAAGVGSTPRRKILVEPDASLSQPVIDRARIVRLMKTAAAIAGAVGEVDRHSSHGPDAVRTADRHHAGIGRRQCVARLRPATKHGRQWVAASSVHLDICSIVRGRLTSRRGRSSPSGLGHIQPSNTAWCLSRQAEETTWSRVWSASSLVRVRSRDERSVIENSRRFFSAPSFFGSRYTSWNSSASAAIRPAARM